MVSIKIGVDVGGTFTDIVGVDDDGKVYFTKTPSTPEDQSIGVVDGIRRMLADLGAPAEKVMAVAHGTTVATNTLLERSGAVTALITTEGFRDVLHIGRQSRSSLYDLRAQKPEPLIPRFLRREAKERTLHTGEINVDLDEADLRRTVRELVELGVESIAVCFLHAYANPTNEQKALAVIKDEAPQLLVSVSSEILPEFREFERMNTTVINAYVQPRMEHYVARLTQRIGDAGVQGPLTIMKSSGGMMTEAVAASKSVNTLLSGPAGGVLAAKFLSDISSFHNIITADMGGTSFDVAVIESGQVGVSVEGVIEGFPVMLPHIEINTIGAGGGSIAWIDAGGALRVGPRSAGARPGPVCYSRGGAEPTVTDANAVLGFIGPEILSGRMKIDVAAARSAIGERVAEPLGMDVETVSEGILRVTNANMVRAIRTMTVEKGIDPRRFIILPYGGAGGLHAVELARALQVEQVVVPIAPGNFSAFGLLAAPIRYDEVVAYRMHQRDVYLVSMENLLTNLMSVIREEMARDGVDESAVAFTRSADIRYFGQAYSLQIELPNQAIDQQVWANMLSDFHEKHLRSYGFQNQNDPVELVNLRLIATSRVDNANLYTTAETGTSLVEPTSYRPAYFQGKWVETAIFWRPNLRPGHEIFGPAVIEEEGATTVLGPGDVATVDSRWLIVIRVADYQTFTNSLDELTEASR